MSQLLNEAIKRFDFLEYVRDKGASEVQRNEFVLFCPGCGKEKLIVNFDKRTWHCWVCEEYGPPDSRGQRKPLKGAGGVVHLVAWLEQLDMRQAADWIIARAKFLAEDLAQIKPAELVSGFLEVDIEHRPIRAPDYFNPIDGMLPYMYKRGITLEDARMFGLGWCHAGRYANRLVFPVWEQGRFVYFQARAMWSESDRPGERYIKALNPGREEGAAVSSELLMNLDQARLYPRVAIVEGPMDCIKAGPSAVCTFGKKISAVQIAKLIRAGVRAIDLMWDGPSEKEPQGAWPEMYGVAPMLQALFDLRLVFLPAGDPGDHSREHLDFFRAQAQSSPSRLSFV